MAATSTDIDIEINDNDTELSDHDELEFDQTTTTPNKKRKLEHPVWDYFEVKNDGVYCTAKGCRAKLALPKSTTNAGKHLRTCHTILFTEYNAKLKSWKETQPRTPSTSKAATLIKQQSITESFDKVVAKNFYNENSIRY
jgi:ribonuclease PH